MEIQIKQSNVTNKQTNKRSEKKGIYVNTRPPMTIDDCIDNI